MNPFIFTGVGALVAAGMAAAKQTNINARKANNEAPENQAEKAKVYTGSDVVEFNKIQSAIDTYIKTTYGANPKFDEQIIAEKTQIFDYCVTSSGAIKGGATYENFTYDPYTSGHENVNSSYPKQSPAPVSNLTNEDKIQNEILNFLKPFVNGDTSQLWRLIDSFYRPSGGDEKSKLSDSSNAWILNGTKVKLFLWASQVVPAPNTPPYTDFSKYEYPGLTTILEAWQEKEKGFIGDIIEWLADKKDVILLEIEKLLKK